MHWIGEGSPSISTSRPGFYLAASVLETNFTVASPVSYTFDGTFAASRSVPCGNCSDSLFATLFVDTGRDEDGEENGLPVFDISAPMPFNGGSSASNPSATGLASPGESPILRQ